MKKYFFKFPELVLLILTGVLISNAQSGHHVRQNEPDENQEEQQNQKQPDRPLQITKKDPPRASVFKDCFKKYGTTFAETIIRVTFDRTGTINGTELYQASECSEFDEEALRVAGLIEFEPAVKNGEPVTVMKLIMYQGGVR